MIVPGYYHYTQLKHTSLQRYDGSNYHFERVETVPGQIPQAEPGPTFKDEWIYVTADGIGTLAVGDGYRDYMDFSRLSHNSKVG